MKTNAMRILDRLSVAYTVHEYDQTVTEGVEVARLLGEDPAGVYKTLVTEAAGGEHLVFVIPVAATLDLKKAARAAQVKSVAMLHQKDLFPLTGYVHGGCSPVGMKKPFRTFFDASASARKTLFVSGGHVGVQMELDVSALVSASGGVFADVTAG